MAFQPIVDLNTRTVFAYEALVRGPQGEGAGPVLAQVDDTNRYNFDQSCRVKAIELAARLKLPATGAFLSINFLPGAVYQPRNCIRATLAAAERTGFPTDKLIFEVTEGEQVKDKAHLKTIIAEYRRQGFKTAIDDFGAGYAGLNLLSEFQPDIIKIDMELTRAIHTNAIRRSIVSAVLGVCAELKLTVIAEGVETPEEMTCLRDLGIHLQQGYFFARPAYEALPEAVFPG
ncbi:MAG: EAL domain-containing protein [Alphaproteobacteria bacterium]|nr:EAL domain-containing protein [Alphaproteobacteria bacterium]